MRMRWVGGNAFHGGFLSLFLAETTGSYKGDRPVKGPAFIRQKAWIRPSAATRFFPQLESPPPARVQGESWQSKPCDTGR